MKCQKCDKPATFHITELTGPEPRELHLCEEHARMYLTAAEQESPVGEQEGLSAAEAVVQHIQLGQAAEKLARLDQEVCPVCGISFYEFRSGGRLGCPNDYDCFIEEIEPLILNIHGETTHKGKKPKRSTGDTSRQTRLISMRREMQEAIEREQYERASELRDEIRRLEKEVRRSE